MSAVAKKQTVKQTATVRSLLTLESMASMMARHAREVSPDELESSMAQIKVYALYIAWLAAETTTEKSVRDTLARLARYCDSPLRNFLLDIAKGRAPAPFTTGAEKFLQQILKLDRDAWRENCKTTHSHLDPMIHVFELFLAEYDTGIRSKRGVYYTPTPIVDYMVRSVDALLREEFKKDQGLADAKVSILDPALGTGNYLASVIDLMSSEKREAKSHLMGFEIMQTSHAISQIVLGAKLSAGKVKSAPSLHWTPSLRNTAQESLKQTRDFVVVLGNPPYAGHSGNTDEWMHDLLRGTDSITGAPTFSYFHGQSEKLKDKNLKWLNDDYVKFFRLAQWQIEQSGQGIVAFVTNNGYLDNPTFRGMRESLLSFFDDLYILDLHGNANKRDVDSEGGADENVFDIKQGVAIAFLVKRKRKQSRSLARISRFDLKGSRAAKFDFLTKNDIASMKWDVCRPEAPEYLFSSDGPPHADHATLKKDYLQGWKLTDIFPVHNVGIVTARDALTIHFTKDELKSTVHRFASLSQAEARQEFSLGADVRDWKVEWAQADLTSTDLDEDRMVPVLYRPFDRRYTYFTGRSRGFHCMPRGETMRHMIATDNLALIATKQTKDRWQIGVSNSIIGHKSVAAYDINSIFPLYLTSTETQTHPNLSSEFIHALEQATSLRFTTQAHFSPDAEFDARVILSYIVAVSCAPSYKQKYNEFLKRDFARIPLPSSRESFLSLCRHGERMIDCLLMKPRKPRAKSNPILSVAGSNHVKHARFEDERVYINETQFFSRITSETWERTFGGYRPAQKWLKDRRGRTLSSIELNEYSELLSSLTELALIEKEIDQVLASKLSLRPSAKRRKQRYS